MSLRNRVTHCLNKARAAYYHNLFGETQQSRKLWLNLRSMAIGKSKSKSNDKLPVPLRDLSEFFGNWGKSEIDGQIDQDKIGDNNQSPSLSTINPLITANAGITSNDRNNLNCLNDSDNFYSLNNRGDPFDIPLIGHKELESHLFCPGSNAIGPDMISRQIIRLSFPFCSRLILHILNFSISNRIFPGQWKRAFICPIPKMSRPRVCADYRPIALTCVLYKIFERIVSRHMISYLELNRKFNPLQSRFRRGMGTQTALLNIVDDIRCAADDREVTVLVLFDFSKAFGTVEHRLLLEKLHSLGFSGATCEKIASYLKNRQQRVFLTGLECLEVFRREPFLVPCFLIASRGIYPTFYFMLNMQCMQMTCKFTCMVRFLILMK